MHEPLSIHISTGAVLWTTASSSTALSKPEGTRFFLSRFLKMSSADDPTRLREYLDAHAEELGAITGATEDGDTNRPAATIACDGYSMVRGTYEPYLRILKRQSSMSSKCSNSTSMRCMSFGNTCYPMELYALAAASYKQRNARSFYFFRDCWVRWKSI